MSPAAAIAALADVFPRRRRRGARVARHDVRDPQPAAAVAPRLLLLHCRAAASASRCRPSIGVQMAQPDRPVVCVLGEGSAQYAIQGFWTAAAYDVPVTFLVLRNEEYAILKWFGEIEQVTGRARPRPARARRRRRWPRATASSRCAPTTARR